MEDAETQTPFAISSEHTPLLPSDAQLLSRLHAGQDYIGSHILSVHGEGSLLWRSRHKLQAFLTSKWGHYVVIALVTLDISGIFADFLISLHICEHAGEKKFNRKAWVEADEALDVLSLVFSCLFMAELLLSVYAFGLRYFRSKFHIFDATVIVAGFTVDVLLRGPVEEVGSLVVVGRLWRVFKIIEEFSSGAEDRMDELQERIEQLEQECEKRKSENNQLRMRIKDGTAPTSQDETS